MSSILTHTLLKLITGSRSGSTSALAAHCFVIQFLRFVKDRLFHIHVPRVFGISSLDPHAQNGFCSSLFTFSNPLLRVCVPLEQRWKSVTINQKAAWQALVIRHWVKRVHNRMVVVFVTRTEDAVGDISDSISIGILAPVFAPVVSCSLAIIP